MGAVGDRRRRSIPPTLTHAQDRRPLRRRPHAEAARAARMPKLASWATQRRDRADQAGVSRGDLHRPVRLPHRPVSPTPTASSATAGTRARTARCGSGSSRTAWCSRRRSGTRRARMDPSFTCANLFWWFNMYSTADYSVTPRPMYPADGRKMPDVYTAPGALRDELQGELGTFPLFEFWGPRASIKSTRWIADAAKRVEQTAQPDADARLPAAPRLQPAARRHRRSRRSTATCGMPTT